MPPRQQPPQETECQRWTADQILFLALKSPGQVECTEFRFPRLLETWTNWQPKRRRWFQIEWANRSPALCTGTYHGISNCRFLLWLLNIFSIHSMPFVYIKGYLCTWNDLDISFKPRYASHVASVGKNKMEKMDGAPNPALVAEISGLDAAYRTSIS